MSRTTVASLILALMVPGVASAATVTRQFTFSATSFEFAIGNGPAPVDPASGTITVTFDDSVDAENVASGVTFSGFNFAVDTVGAAPAYSFYTDFYGAGPTLELGTVCRCGTGSVGEIGPGVDGFVLGIFDPAGTADSGFFGFSQAGFADVAFADAVTIQTTGVPEPGTWLMMMAGLGGVGAAARRARPSLTAPNRRARPAR